MGTLDGKIVGNAIVHKTLHEVSSYLSEEDLLERFKKLDGAIVLSNELSEGFKLVRAAALCLMNDIWEELPFNLRKEYDLQFRLYAEKRCPEINWKTIQNHMRAAQTYLLTGVKPKEPIVIEGQRVDFDPTKVPISKLVLARSAVENNKIDNNPVLWKMLVDERVPVYRLRTELFSEESKKANIDPVVRYDLVGPYLTARKNGEEAVLGNFDWEEYYKGGLVREAVDRILRFCDVVPDEEFIMSHLRKESCANYNDK